jgi:vacuolar-type H+-ATPase catalytic subunit A/Vma1
MVKAGSVKNCRILQLLFGKVDGTVFEKMNQMKHFFQIKDSDSISQVINSLSSFFDKNQKVENSLVSIKRKKFIKPK